MKASRETSGICDTRMGDGTYCDFPAGHGPHNGPGVTMHRCTERYFATTTGSGVRVIYTLCALGHVMATAHLDASYAGSSMEARTGRLKGLSE